MKYRWLGSSGLLVSRISLGTMTFGTDNWGCGEKESHAILRAYVDAGGNLIDCADVYAAGRSEEIIGSFLPQVNRDELVIASKCDFPMGQKPNQSGIRHPHGEACRRLASAAEVRQLRHDRRPDGGPAQPQPGNRGLGHAPGRVEHAGGAHAAA